ncbi:MAG: hypothetical protein NTZ11_00610 [Gammaproteobacteria bacterium]|nr:hypothetical protein [Gammaproteobacteria bacterium]
MAPPSLLRPALQPTVQLTARRVRLPQAPPELLESLELLELLLVPAKRATALRDPSDRSSAGARCRR